AHSDGRSRREKRKDSRRDRPARKNHASFAASADVSRNLVQRDTSASALQLVRHGDWGEVVTLRSHARASRRSGMSRNVQASLWFRNSSVRKVKGALTPVESRYWRVSSTEFSWMINCGRP